jgi:rhodanese-related sulfurtransferase
MKTITAQELDAQRSLGQKITLFDVRTPVEYREVHIPFAKNLPLSELNVVEVKEMQKSGDPIYIVCKSGGRGKQACEKLIAAGCFEVINIEGGTQAWLNAGLPVIRGKKAISLERQVRIAAGTMVFFGVLIGYFVHEIFLGLAGFVGAGLVFAGVTDTCGMGMILARMPWNRVVASSEASSGQSCTTN